MKKIFSMTEDKSTSENHGPETDEDTEPTVPPEELELKPEICLTETDESEVNPNEMDLTGAEEMAVKVNYEEESFTVLGDPEVNPCFSEVEEVRRENRGDTESQQAAMETQTEFEYPEGGWGWVVMLASMWCNGLMAGIESVFGILFVYMLKQFGSEDDEDLRFRTAWVGSLSTGMSYACCPIVSVFTDVFGFRIMAVGGATLGLIGLLASSFVKSLGVMYFTYGVVFACGCSFVYQLSIVILGHYFKKRLGLVNGVVMAGCSVFTVSLSFLLPTLLERIGLPNTFRVLSALMFLVVLAGFTFKPRLPQTLETTKVSLKRICNFQVWRNRNYRIWAFGIQTALYGYAVPYVHLIEYVDERFSNNANQEVLLVCIASASGVGRLVFGRVTDYVPGGYKVLMQAISITVLGVMTMLIPVCNVFGGLIAVCVVMGLSDGCFISSMAPIAFELVGSENASQALGFVLGMISVPMLVGPPIAGILHDRLGSYDLAFYLAGVPALIGGAVLCAVPWLEWRKKKSERKNEPHNSITQE